MTLRAAPIAGDVAARGGVAGEAVGVGVAARPECEGRRNAQPNRSGQESQGTRAP